MNTGFKGHAYYYDPSDRQVAKTTGGATLNYVYDLAGNVLFGTQGWSWMTADIYFAGALHAQYKNSTMYFLHRDHLGPTRLVTGLATQVVDNLDHVPGRRTDRWRYRHHSQIHRQRTGQRRFRNYASTMGDG